ncbi:MAG: PEGA domain-containing protein, partial [Myxococcaceae bacterium]
MTPALVLTSLLLLGAGPSKGRAGEQHYAQGQNEFNRGNFQGALKLLDAAATETNDDATLSKIHLLRGQAFAAEQDFDQTEAAFKLALEHDPEASLDPARVDPKLVRILDGLRDRMKGDLNVRAEVPGSKVTIDGRYEGESPVSTTQPIGRHKVEVVSPDGRQTGKSEVVVWPKRVTELALKQEETRDKTPPPAAPTATSSRRGFADL